VGSIRDNEYKKHRWIIRFGEQILCEARHATVYLKQCYDDRDYGRMIARMKSRRADSRIEWRSIPTMSGRACIHIDPQEGGRPLPISKPELYGTLLDLVDDMTEGGRAGASGGWGMEYGGAKGDGRQDVDLHFLCQLAVAEARVGGDYIEVDTEGMNVKTIRQFIGKVGRDSWAGVLEAELLGKCRKSVLKMVRSRLRPVLQIFSRESIVKIAAVLKAKLNVNLIGIIRRYGGDVISDLKTAGIEFMTRHGHDILAAYEEYFFADKEQDGRLDGNDMFLIGKFMAGDYAGAVDYEPPPLTFTPGRQPGGR
jgi:hypothetical protein